MNVGKVVHGQEINRGRIIKMLKKNYLNRLLITSVALVSVAFIPSHNVFAENTKQVCSEESQYTVRRLASEQEDNICQRYKGQLILIVNTASRCGYTDQYDDLEKLYSEYKERGLVVIGFPSNDFGGQEPGTEKKIKNFCRLTYGVKFPMYAKTHVKGENAEPLYKKLSEVSGQSPKWNFHKYLINRDGELIGSYRSSIEPYNRKIIEAIEKNL